MKRKQRSKPPQSDIPSLLSCIDIPSLALSLCMAVYGIVVIYSAVHAQSGGKYVAVQVLACIIGCLGLLGISLLDYESVLKKFSVPLFLLTVLILGATLLIGTGEGTNKSWIRLSGIPIGIQPSEFAKLLFICTFSCHLNHVREHLDRITTVLGLCLHFGVICGLVLLQGDLGSALVFVFIFLCMLYGAGMRLRYFFLAALLALGASPFLWKHLSTYQQQRILVGFSPESDPQGFGYQVLRAKEAIANGGLWGMGYLAGELSQSTAASALPKRHTDIIFAVMAEEFGFVGVLLYLALFVALILRILWISRKARGYMGSYLCIGVAAVFLFQGLENIGMCLGLLPVIGLTLPFISYGGSSCVSLFWMIGAVESVAVHRVKYYIERNDEVD